MTTDRFQYRYSTLAEVGRALGTGRTSTGAIVDEALTLMRTVGAEHRAVAAINEDRARIEGERAARRRAQGPSTPVTGVPYAVKDVIAARGAPTSWGVPSLIDRVIEQDATVVSRLKRAGAVLVGKVVTTALAGGGGHKIAGWSAHGQPHNPWNRSRFAGSSSSGSAVSVALGIVPIALGTETGGSVMQPAAFCGITGYRPTFGQVPRTGTMPLSYTLDKIGVLAHTAEDCATVARIIRGPDTGDSYTVTAPRLRPARSPDTLRVGIAPAELTGLATSMQNRASAWQAEVRALSPRVIDCEIDSALPYGKAIETMIRAESAEWLAGELSDPTFRLTDEYQYHQLMTARDMPIGEYIRASHTLDLAKHEFTRIFRAVDIIVCTTFPTQPQLLSEPRPPRSAGTVAERLLAAANLAGLPGVTLPCGLDDDGLPVGIHVVGPPGSDLTLLQFGMAYQAMTSHHRLRPPALS